MLTAVRNLGIKVLGTMRTGFDRPEAPSMNDATQVQRSQGRPSCRRFLWETEDFLWEKSLSLFE